MGPPQTCWKGRALGPTVDLQNETWWAGPAVCVLGALEVGEGSVAGWSFPLPAVHPKMACAFPRLLFWPHGGRTATLHRFLRSENSFLLQQALYFSFSKFWIFLFFQSFGFSLLARSNYHWQLSFSQAEQVLLEQLDEDGGCRRQCFQAVRQLLEDVWCPGKRPVITSHHLQVSCNPRKLWIGGTHGLSGLSGPTQKWERM